MRALGAYIFAGGFTLGVRQHFDVLAHLEETPYGVATFKRNVPEVPVCVGPERWDDFLTNTLGVGPGDLDFIYGNPPCAAWSVAGRNHGAGKRPGATNNGVWQSDARVDCTRSHFGLWRRLRPRVWVTESVSVAWQRGESFWRELAEELRGAGYSATAILHNARYHGVPQHRPRFFFVAHAVEFDPQLRDARELTIDEALAGLNDPGEPLEHNLGKHRELLKVWPQGWNGPMVFESVYPRETWQRNRLGQVVGRLPFTIKRARSGQPAPVVMHELVHPTEDRGLSIKELATLCGYPPLYEFIGAKDAGQVGRGVCPPVGAWLAGEVRRALEANVPVTTPEFRLIDLSCPPGRREVLSYEGGTSVSVKETVVEELPRTIMTVRDVRPKEGLGSGAYIRLLLSMGQHSPEEIIELVRRHYPTSKASVKDVAWNRGRLKREERVEAVERQPQAERKTVDPARRFDTSSLRERAHGQWVHRDYGAHFFRWGFAGRFVNQEVEVLDVGCGPDGAFIGALTMPRNNVPKRYVGVDLNSAPRTFPSRQWATLHWGFDFLERHGELGQFDLVTNFEVIEHMRKPDGERLLAGLRACLKPEGRLLLSTPVFNGKAAANHLHEWTVPELAQAIEAAGLTVVRRHGTFASWNDLKRAATPSELDLVKRLGEYYSGEVLACFLAPLYPDASRNNVWVLERKE